jgi:hypothetical protein
MEYGVRNTNALVTRELPARSTAIRELSSGELDSVIGGAGAATTTSKSSSSLFKSCSTGVHYPAATLVS